MQIRSKFYVNRFLLGTGFSIGFICYSFPSHELMTAAVFLVSILLNQYLLAVFVADLTGIEVNTSILPTWLCGSLKLLVLVAGFYYALRGTKNKALILVFLYIFQLIILGISTKRVVKNN